MDFRVIVQSHNHSAADSVSGNALARAAAQYAKRFEAIPSPFDVRPAENLGLVVTVPAYDEPQIERSLKSLAACRAPAGDVQVEVLLLINAPADAPQNVKQRNEEAYKEAKALALALAKPWLRVFVEIDNALPPQHAGVGLARKALMDAALERLAQVRRTQATPAVIAAFDADCECDENYLTSLIGHFEATPELAGASIYFEHDLSDALTHDAIVHYELYLRSYRLGLIHANSPYAHHTVGSSMAVNAFEYAKLGGMNRKQAGEDFYFLQKFMGTGRFKALNSTCVRPSARVSSRVPFGTGAAVSNTLESGAQVPFYDCRVYDDLRQFYGVAEQWCRPYDHLVGELPQALQGFLKAYAFPKRLEQIKQNTASAHAISQHVNAWMNGFRCMKFARFASQQFYGYADVANVVASLITRLDDIKVTETLSEVQQLLRLRQLDRRH